MGLIMIIADKDDWLCFSSGVLLFLALLLDKV